MSVIESQPGPSQALCVFPYFNCELTWTERKQVCGVQGEGPLHPTPGASRAGSGTGGKSQGLYAEAPGTPVMVTPDLVPYLHIMQCCLHFLNKNIIFLLYSL